MRQSHCHLCFFFFNDTATTEIYTLSLHDALPISSHCGLHVSEHGRHGGRVGILEIDRLDLTLIKTVYLQYAEDRKSTRLNSSHLVISYAVFCLKKKKNINDQTTDSLPCTRDTYR